MNFTIEIDMDKKCRECGRCGATNSGLCLKCVGKKIKDMGKQKNRKDETK